MELTDEQKGHLSEQLASGASIADIQRLINEEFKIHMTYMEVRFLMDDLNLELAEPPQPEPEDDTPDASDADDGTPTDAEAELVDAGPGQASGVSVELDRIKRPGAALSGTVTFSDGVNAKWYVDPYGRLGLESDQEDYQPSPGDVEAFQLELQKQMQGPEGMA